MNVQNYAATSNQRTAGSNFQTPSAGSAPVKDSDGDSDGDRKPAATAQTMSSSAVQAALTNLKVGG